LCCDVASWNFSTFYFNRFQALDRFCKKGCAARWFGLVVFSFHLLARISAYLFFLPTNILACCKQQAVT